MTTSTNTELSQVLNTNQFSASAITFEKSHPYIYGGLSVYAITLSVRIRPYTYVRGKAVYGDPIVVSYEHPQFREVLSAARAKGLLVKEVSITNDNLAEFSKAVLSNEYIKNPMDYIKGAMDKVMSA